MVVFLSNEHLCKIKNRGKMEIENSIVVITGVRTGIGLAAVKKFVNAGARVAGWGRTAPDFEHPNFRFVSCDVRDEAMVKSAMEETVALWGDEIRILVNNAGLGRYGRMDEQSHDEWHLQFDTNVHGLWYVSKAVVPLMKKYQVGHIFNISSIAGKDGIEGMSAYSATKWAVRGLTLSWMKELRNDGIKVTGIYPGSTQTEFFDPIPGYEAHGQMMQPEDIATSIVELAGTSFNYLPVELEIRPLQPKPLQ
jgi:NADP-dependent 3-hydroxy acid dehydrogenase YdfG